MDPRQTSKRPCTTTEVYDKNAKQREMYRDMPTAEKNALLLRRRLKKREATTTRLLPNTNSVNPVEPIYVSQDNLDVGCSSSISKTAPTVLQKGKEVAHPFRSFEEGSTSGTSNALHAPTAEKVSIARKARTIVGIDDTIESDNQTQFEDLLHTLNPAGILCNRWSAPFKLFHLIQEDNQDTIL